MGVKKLIKTKNKADRKFIERISKAAKDQMIPYGEPDEDSPELTEDDFADAIVVPPPKKKGIYIQLDPEVLEWFRGRGRGYQGAINNILKQFVAIQKKKAA